MIMRFYHSFLVVMALALTCTHSLSSNSKPASSMSRRAALGLIGSSPFAVPLVANAAADCFTDCVKSCKTIAPKDTAYCTETCKAYCEQDDRTDGLSGSISSTGGETGILGLNTVVKGEDKPPQIKIPGLDFGSDKGKKLIGY
jgi:hypothetical protein